MKIQRKIVISLIGGIVGPIIGLIAMEVCFGFPGNGGREGIAAALSQVMFVIYVAVWFPWGILTFASPEKLYTFIILFIADGITWSFFLFFAFTWIKKFFRKNPNYLNANE